MEFDLRPDIIEQSLCPKKRKAVFAFVLLKKVNAFSDMWAKLFFLLNFVRFFAAQKSL